MLKACLAFVFLLTLAIPGFSQTNSEDASKTPPSRQPLPVNPKVVQDSTQKADSLKAIKNSRKSKAKKEVAKDSAAAKTSKDSAERAKAAKDSVAAAVEASKDTLKTPKV